MNTILANIPLNVDWKQILLHVLNLVILFVILYFLLYSPVKKFMEKRKKHYEDMENDANAKIKEGENLKTEYENLLQTEQEKQEEIINSAKKTAETEKAKIIADAKEKASAIIEKAGIKANEIKASTEEKVNQEFTDLIIEKASKEFSDVDANYQAFLKSASEVDDAK